MEEQRTLAEVISTGVEFSAQEAVAVVLELIEGARRVPLRAPLGPPSLENVLIGRDGSVACNACDTTPAVFELAILLETALKRCAGRVPGALRYTIARALLDVDAPPFDSVAEFAAALKRHENGDRSQVIRDLAVRVEAHAAARVVAFPVDRRRRGASSTDLRRHLRELDEQLFLLRASKQAPAPVVDRDLVAESVAAMPALPDAIAAPAPEPIRAEPVAFAHHAPVVPPPELEPAFPSSLIGPAVAHEPRFLLEPDRDDSDEPRRHAGALRWTLRAAAAVLAAFAVGYGVIATAPRLDRAFSEAMARRTARLAPAEAPLLQSRVTVPFAAPTIGEGDREAQAVEPRAPDVIRAVARSSGPMFSPAFASNGTALFFHTGRTSDARSALEAADLTGGLQVMTIVDDGSRNYHVQPSPDGTRVAFDSDRDGERGVYIANRDGTGVRRVSGTGYAAIPTWSPDGGRLAFARAETDRSHVWNLWLLTLDSGEMRRLTNFRYGQTWSASWFPDGRRICFSHEDRLAVIDLDLDNPYRAATREFASPIPRRLVRTPAVSPDGRHVIFQVSGSGAWLLDLADGTMRCVLTDPSAEEFAWSPDGRRVAFHSRRDGQWGIWIMTTDQA